MFLFSDFTVFGVLICAAVCWGCLVLLLCCLIGVCLLCFEFGYLVVGD